MSCLILQQFVLWFLESVSDVKRQKSREIPSKYLNSFSETSYILRGFEFECGRWWWACWCLRLQPQQQKHILVDMATNTAVGRPFVIISANFVTKLHSLSVSLTFLSFSWWFSLSSQHAALHKFRLNHNFVVPLDVRIE